MNPKDREHVTFQFWKYDLGYKSIQLINKTDLSRYRFTVDYQEDFEVISHLYKTLSRMNVFGNLEEIVAIINNNNNLINLNSSFKAGEGW